MKDEPTEPQVFRTASAMSIILGVALAIALVLKIYMLVLTDYVCEPDGATLGNLIRCTATLDLVATFFAATATINAATISWLVSAYTPTLVP